MKITEGNTSPDAPVRVQLVRPDGTIVAATTLQNSAAQWRGLEHLPAGNYFVRLRQGPNEYTTMVVKVK